MKDAKCLLNMGLDMMLFGIIKALGYRAKELGL